MPTVDEMCPFLGMGIYYSVEAFRDVGDGPLEHPLSEENRLMFFADYTLMLEEFKMHLSGEDRDSFLIQIEPVLAEIKFCLDDDVPLTSGEAKHMLERTISTFRPYADMPDEVH
jgi:hypothetical protein